MSNIDMKSLIEKMDDIDDLFRDKPKASSCSMCGGDHDLDEECNIEEDYDNAPGEQYADFDDVATKSGNDLLKSKSSSPAAAGGDNPLPLRKKFKSIDESREEIESRIRAELTALYKL